MKLIKYILAATVALAATGCAVNPTTVRVKTPFVTSEHDPFMKSGASTISGQAFLKQNGGGVVTCAGSTVYLFPRTTYFNEFIADLKSGLVVDPRGDAPAAYSSLLRPMPCDAQGNFSFKNLPAGNWTVVSDVMWNSAHSSEGGSLFHDVVTTGNDSQSVILSNGDLMRR